MDDTGQEINDGQETNESQDANDEQVQAEAAEEESSEPEAVETGEPWLVPFDVAGFWRRALGGIVDWIVLAILSLVIIVTLGQAAYRLGIWARLIGVVLGTFYLGLTASELTNGRSLGKRVAGTQVIDEDNTLLTPGRGLLRGLFLSVMLAGVDLVAAIPALGPMAGALAGAGALLIVYGYVFNRQTRQGTHDLQMRTYVVRYPRPQLARPPERSPIHMRVVFGCGGLTVIGLVVSSILALAVTSGNPLERLGLLREGETDDLFAVRSELLQSGNYREVGVSRFINTTFQNGERITQNELRLQVIPKKPCSLRSDHCEILLSEIEETVREVIPDLSQYDRMRVEFVNLVDTGWFQGRLSYGNFVDL